jgi:hypothetical protein
LGTVVGSCIVPGGSNCKGPAGAVCDYSEAGDLNSSALDGGGGFNLSYFPMQKTTWGTCEVVLPHNFIRVNTIFEVGRANGLVTAYADKHPSYEMLNGPSGTGLSQGKFSSRRVTSHGFSSPLRDRRHVQSAFSLFSQIRPSKELSLIMRCV